MNIAVNVAPIQRRLSNGLYVSIFPESHFHHTFVSWSVSYGSIHDAVLPGRAHFLEHMMFYNPDKRPLKSRFHALGASTSALTRYDLTTYQMACTGQFKQSMELFIRMLATPYFTPIHMEKERAAIHQELSMYEDQPSWRALQRLTQMMYGNNHPITSDVAGTPDSLYQLTPDEMNTAYNEYYATGNMAVAVAGPVNPEAVIEILEQFPVREGKTASLHGVLPWDRRHEEFGERYLELECGLPLSLVRFGFRVESGMELKDQVACIIGIEALLGETSDFYAECIKSGLLGKGAAWDHYYRQEFAFSNACGYSTDPASLRTLIEERCNRIQERGVSLNNLGVARLTWLSRYYTDMDSLKQRCMHVSEHTVIGLDYLQIGTYVSELTEEEIISSLRKVAAPDQLRMVVLH
ncbi:pitrilysin family protein [Paenibacillus sp. UMB7766-LJ446]|uniref:M16 family metallopeptidase n=1 Tax=Paenibacillus sp. UMB7766-LJ446 TaxID=3046313 RepID=UPI00254CD4AC|nr:pitrilysin family protein [Paenibacillus sp. UMB7766-LJ446]MDK8193020.1 pitrilysin family protein [Paenibacillus sp. UMB7766-LJ446]